MKCPRCNGSGKSTIAVAENPFTGAGGFFPKCKKCNGTGEVFKCPKCGEFAYLSNWGSLFDHDYAWYNIECKKCGYRADGGTDPQKAKEMFVNGIGNIPKPLTEQEYIQSCNTEQLAEFLIASIKNCKSCANGIGIDEVQHCPFGECGCHFKDEVVKWLKQPHTFK